MGGMASSHAGVSPHLEDRWEGRWTGSRWTSRRTPPRSGDVVIPLYTPAHGGEERMVSHFWA